MNRHEGTAHTCKVLAAVALLVVAAAAHGQKIEKVEKAVGVFLGATTAGQAAEYAETHAGAVFSDPDTFGLAYGAYGNIEYKGYAGEVGVLLRTDQEIGTTEVKRNLFYVAAMLDLPLKYTKKPKVTTFVKLGLARWSVESTDLSVLPYDDHGVDPLVGLGAKIQVSKKIDVRTEAVSVFATPQAASDRQYYFLLSGQYSW